MNRGDSSRQLHLRFFLLHSVALLLIYLLLPIVLGAFLPGRDWIGVMSTLLFIVNPIATAAASFLFAYRHGFRFYIPVITCVLFIPAVFIAYNYTAWPNAFIYLGTSSAACLIASHLRADRKKRRLFRYTR